MYKVLFAIILSAFRVYCIPSTLRQTLYGPIEGVERTSILGQKYYAFEGIPYAEPPITGIDPYTGKQVDRRFKVYWRYFHTYVINYIVCFSNGLNFLFMQN